MNPKAITPLLARVIAFFGAFVLLSGLIGPRIISSDLLYQDYFFVYGSLGKALLFAGIAFLLLVRSHPLPAITSWQPKMLGWAIAGTGVFGGAWISIDQLINHHNALVWVVAAHLLIISSVALAFLACFGLRNTCQLAHHYKQPGLYAVAAGTGFYVLLHFFYTVWGFFSGIVLHAVRFLLDISGLATQVISPHTLLLDKFGVTIAQSCSGVESMALFTGLYAVVGLLDKDKLDWRRFLSIFPLALAGLFVCNIFRVYLLIMGGYHINPEIAFSLFHTYAGMVFFIIYALLFWKVSYRWILRNA